MIVEASSSLINISDYYDHYSLHTLYSLRVFYSSSIDPFYLNSCSLFDDFFEFSKILTKIDLNSLLRAGFCDSWSKFKKWSITKTYSSSWLLNWKSPNSVREAKFWSETVPLMFDLSCSVVKEWNKAHRGQKQKILISPEWLILLADQ